MPARTCRTCRFDSESSARDALLYLIRHWHDLHGLRRLVIEMAETLRQREVGRFGHLRA